MYCSKCGKENKDETLFCISCGSRFRVDGKCPVCNSDVKKEENFCPSCGYNVSGKSVGSKIYTLIPIIISFCVLPLLLFIGLFDIANFFDPYLYPDLLTVSGASSYFLLLTIILFTITFGIITLVTKSKIFEILHDFLTIFISLFFFLFCGYLAIYAELGYAGFFFFLFTILYLISSLTFTIIKSVKKLYTKEA